MATEPPVLGSEQRFTVWYIVAAVLLIALGLFAIIEPAVAPRASSLSLNGGLLGRSDAGEG
jgi:hypothetical protein